MSKRYKQISFSVSHYEEKIFKELSEKGISSRKVIEYISTPCECCKGVIISVLNNDGEQVLIPKGILSKRKMKTKPQLRYYFEAIGEDMNLYAIPNEERVLFWKEHPLAKEVDKKVYDTLLFKLQQLEGKNELIYNK